MTEEPSVIWTWNEEYKVGMMIVFGTPHSYRGYRNEAEARKDASKRLELMNLNLGTNFKLPRKS